MIRHLRAPRPASSSALVASLALALGAAACASSNRAQSQPSGIVAEGNSVAELNTAGASFNFRKSASGSVQVDTVQTAAANLWPHLAGVYEELSIPVEIRNPEAGLLGVTNFQVTRKLGVHRLSLYLRCGSSITGSLADNSQIMMTVVTQVRDADLSGLTSQVVTLVDGTARQHGLSSSSTDCDSTGRLEQEILNRLQIAMMKGRGGGG